MKTFDVLVAGEINPDLILSAPNLTAQFGQVETLADEMELTIGSSSAIFACGAARLGLKVAFIGVVGADQFGSFMVSALEQKGVDCSHVIVDPNLQTGLSTILSRGADRAIVTFLGAIASLRADQITPTLLESTRHLHVGSYFLQPKLWPGMPDVFRKAQALGVSTSLDTNWDPSGSWSGIDELLAVTDVFFPNDAEGLSLSGADTPEEAASRLAQKGNTVAMKMGKSGAIACRGTETASAPSLAVPVVDTVGAGDSFDAGFLYGYLNHWTLEESLRLGTVCGSLSTRAHGGTAAQADISEAKSYLK
jgi:sugar/nucleoside kinase (ribokinase family)